MTRRRVATHLAALALAAGCAPSSAKSSGPPPLAASRDVALVAARTESWEQAVRVPAELVAQEDATLATKVAGRIAAIDVDVGARVRAGDRLAQIERRDFELRVDQARAAIAAARARLGLPLDGDDDAVEADGVAIVRKARAELDDAGRENDRLRGMSKEGVASQSALDASTARLATAQGALQDARDEVANRRALLIQRRAELALAVQQLEDARIVAPFDGAVAARLADRGEFLAVGAPVVRLVRFDPVRLRLELPAQLAGRVAAGTRVRVAALRSGAEPLAATIARVAPELDPRNRTLLAECDLANGDGAFAPGLFLTADVVVDATATALVVPVGALVRFAGVDRVVAEKEGRAVERRVNVGRVDAARAEIVAGLSAGDPVVAEPGSLRGGDPIRVVR